MITLAAPDNHLVTRFGSAEALNTAVLRFNKGMKVKVSCIPFYLEITIENVKKKFIWK